MGEVQQLDSNSQTPPTIVSAAASGRNAAFTALRLFVAILLLSAAGLKGYELAMSPAAKEGLLTSRPFLIGVVEVELLLAACLLSGAFPRCLWAVTLACFALFAEVSFYQATTGAESCGCFGRLSINPWYTFTLDMTIIAALLLWRPSQTNETDHRSTDSRRFAFACGIALAVGVPAGGLMSTFSAGRIADSGTVLGNEKVVVLDAEAWVGKRCPILSYIDVGERLKNGNWIVALYNHGCASCEEAIPRYLRIAGETAFTPNAPRIALIEMPPYAATDESLATPESQCLLGRLSNRREWFAATPLEIMLREGVTVSARPHAKPSDDDSRSF